MNFYVRLRSLALLVLILVLFAAGCSRPMTPVDLPTLPDRAQNPPAAAVVQTPTLPEPGISETGQLDATLTPTRPPPTTTVDPRVDAACLVGNWEVVDLPQAMADSYAQSGSSLQLQQVEGSAFYAFTADGSMKITFAQMAATLTGTLDNRAVTARQSIDGSATARYNLDRVEKQLILSDFGGSGILFSLAINQQVLVEGDLPIWRAFTSAISGGAESQPATEVQYARVSMDCQADRLLLRAVDPVSGPEITLRRVQ